MPELQTQHDPNIQRILQFVAAFFKRSADGQNAATFGNVAKERIARLINEFVVCVTHGGGNVLTNHLISSAAKY